MKTTPSQEYLKSILSYCEDTGRFTWLVSRGRVSAGTIAGTLIDRGYVSVFIDGEKYRAHRLAWVYMIGREPADQIDHINGDRSDNRFRNLREATRSENSQNMAVKRKSKTGILGVDLASTGKFVARIGVDGRQRHLGTHDTKEGAHAAYLAEKAVLHSFQPVPRGVTRSSFT
ncbi:HNH endonuclease [Massilia antarctica]|uniref:HNH endonuclease n=1 Tax=Massilia antarctica TaxID=2765360 RepID=UPI00226D9D60|nr:HNH endonuclease [Massilia sp. H27-R4]MCY0910856.1 HNH endonuclease [Massilia sp. H27-R4]